MEKKDIKQIRKEISEVLEDNISPQFEEIREDVKEIKANMVTKVYFDDRLVDLDGGLIN